MRRSPVLTISLLACGSSALVAQSVQSVGGRVLGDSTPLAGAIVSVTMAPDRILRQDTTRADGRWRVTFSSPTGDYLVHIAAAGRVSFRKRVTVAATDSFVVIDATLASSVQQLPIVKVEARRPRPSREGEARTPDPSSAEYLPYGVYGSVTPDLAGNFAAMANTIPGLSLAPGGGITAFGLDPSQSSTTLNGLSFPGASLPRNASTSTRFTTSTYDPARGGFAGVETAVTLSQGDINTRRTGNLTLDAPMLQVSDGRQLGQRVTAGQASAGGSGAWVEDKWYYNASADLSRRMSAAPSLLATDASLFPLAGIAPDSVARLLATLSTLRVPVSVAGDPTHQVTDKVSFALRVDHAPYLPGSFSPSPHTWAIVALGNVNRDGAQGVGLTSTPARGSQTAREYGLLQGIYSAYVTHYSLSEARTGLFISRARSTPDLRLPGGSVLVSSALPDGSTGAGSLAFGGNAGSDSEDNTWNWDTRADHQWYARPTHKLKVTGGSRFDGYRSRDDANSLGDFGFASLADVATNHPSSFTRTLGQVDRTGAAWNGFASLGDTWKASPTVQIIYGARLEGNRYLSTPAYNAALDNSLGVRSDAAPTHLHVSPRLGFSWRYGGENAGYNGWGNSNLGTKLLGSSGVIRGGIGEFRSTLSPQLLGAPSVSTGLSDAVRRVSCVGAAVPMPDWSAYATDVSSIPVSCVSAPGAPLLADLAPRVHVIDPSFDAPRSWRASLGGMTLVKKIALTVDASASINLDQASSVDVNFAGRQRFSLSDEARPVFASASGIDPASGFFSTVDSRRSAAFGPVVRRQSDLRSVSRQITVGFSPEENWSSRMLNVSYTLASNSGDARGFDGAAFGDPRTIEHARGDLDVRHRFQVQAGRYLWRGFSATAFVVAASGLPYTPTVSGDVNGDGIGRDRAYVFNPSTTANSTVSDGMRALLASAPSGARACLLSQLGAAAARNSCEGPWTTSAAARIGYANTIGPWGHRVSASLGIANPLAGFDRLLHGESGLHGWGTMISPDPTLLIIRGFDPQANRFRYDVNPRFGSTSLAQSTIRAPFRISVDVSFDLGPSMAQQQLERVLNPGRGGRRGTRLPADSIRLRFARNVPSIYAAVIEEADSLLLSRMQVDSLRAANERWERKVDVIWTRVANDLAAMSDDYDVPRATQMTEDATDAAWELARLEIPTLRSILSPLQFSLAPGNIQYLANAQGKIRIRIYYY
ncbi:hypothetical protein BH09GEM1_BH09GEM1_01170 [soil metagenome]